MAGCRSCSGCSPDLSISPTKKAEKLEKAERSNNERYPHVFVGKQAIYSDDCTQAIVTVIADKCDDECDCFVLQPQRVLRNSDNKIQESAFEIVKSVGETCWKLHALI